MSLPSLLALLFACAAEPEPTVEIAAPPPPPAPKPTFDAIDRETWNRRAPERGVWLYWAHDDLQPGTLNPEELVAAWGPDGMDLGPFVASGGFTAEFERVYAAMSAADGVPPSDPAEAARRAAVLAELRAGRPTLLVADLRGVSAPERAMIGHLLRAARGIERLYAIQRGTDGLADGIPQDDPASRALFFRNQGPRCESPAKKEDPACHARPDRAAPVLGLYPASVQSDPAFCKTLEEKGGDLLAPFTVVREDGGALSAVPYTVAWQDDMREVAAALEDAAAALEGTEEKALQAYLRAAADAFRSNDWFAADAAWAAMNDQNSRWYLRVGPDETYFEPCNRKAGFHLTFARMDARSLAWRQKLDPVKQDMERALAEKAGPPYVAREVAFDLPEFIEIVLNAGDSRNGLGATIGQSLPNWGPVAEQGGRTVAMTNLDGDADTRKGLRKLASSVLCADAMTHYTDDPEALLASTVLHEAAHNLGPAQEYRVDGKTDEEVFGGPLASMYEELKAQTAALWYTDWLAGRGLLDRGLVRQTHTADLVWSFGKISQGSYAADGSFEAYPMLASIQVAYLTEQGALSWRASEKAANGEDLGCVAVDHDKLPGAIDALAGEVFGHKARLDVTAASAFKQRFVDDPGAHADLRAVITERWRRGEQSSWVYAVQY